MLSFGKNILLIEDDQITKLVLNRLLTNQRHRVIAPRTYQQSQQLIVNDYDVALVDYNLSNFPDVTPGGSQNGAALLNNEEIPNIIGISSDYNDVLQGFGTTNSFSRKGAIVQGDESAKTELLDLIG